MLDMDESARASMAEVLSHPWMRQRLPPNLEAGLAHVRASQARREAQTDAYSARAGDAVISTLVRDALDRAAILRRRVRAPRRSEGSVNDERPISCGVRVACVAHIVRIAKAETAATPSLRRA